MTKPKERKLLKDPDTRSKILAAAQEVFAEKGYLGAGFRDIAAVAGVSTNLPLKYFGSKAGMFDAALRNLIPAELPFQSIDRSRFGQIVVRMILTGNWGMKAPAMVALAIGDPAARDATVRSCEESVIRPLASWLGPPQAETRALELIMVTLGLMIYTKRLPVMPHLVGPNKELGKWFASTIQSIVDRTH